jgi:hypothetical protein
MPTRQSHIKQAKANLAALEVMPADLYTWRVTARFYTALHLIDAVFDEVDHEHPNSHVDRFDLLSQRHYGLTHLTRMAYIQLENFSREARYDCPSRGRLEFLDKSTREDLDEIVEVLSKRLGI